MNPASEILLITRVRTVNKGNQALSAAWVSMLQRAFPALAIRVLERRPPHLTQFTLEDVARADDPVAAFDAIATELAALAPGPEHAGGPPAHTRIELDETVHPPARFVSLRRRVNGRGRLARLGWYADAYRSRLAACQRARIVVVNPAGEFYPREPQPAFYHLLDACVAHKLGRPTAIVNHTMDIADPTLRAIIPTVYRTLDLVGFRDRASVEAFQAMGGDLSNVLVTPDLALTAEVGRAPARRVGTIAVAINVPQATAGGYLEGWATAIAGLRAAGLTVVLVSNELPVDRAFYASLQRRFPELALEGAGLDHDRYAELLGGFDLVATSRMHTGILAMVAGTPVIAVEGSSFKITGLVRELGLVDPVVSPTGERWPQQLVDQAVALHARRAAASADLAVRVCAIRERITASLVPKLHEIARRST